MTTTNNEKNYSPQQELESFGYAQQLNRVLNFWQLTAFGLNYMIPIAPAIIFGFILQTSGGSVAIPYLLAGLAMSFTALSYGILVKRFPIAGSLYSFVSRAWDAHIGFIAGWVLLLDYILIPTVTAMSAAIYIREFLPSISYCSWLFLFVAGTGLINLFGVNIMARLGLWLLLIGEIVILVGFIVWSYAVGVKGIGVGHLLSLEPFKFQSISALATASSLAVLSYLGFDAITTLAEEALDPKRDIPRAIFWSVLIGGFTMFITGYLAMLVIPHWQQFSNDQDWINTTLFYVTKITGGNGVALFYTSGFLLAMAVFNIVATAAGARLLLGMGRDGVLPKNIFSAINHRWRTPHWNIIIITVLEFLIGALFTIDNITELVNYGALVGFILLNLSVIWLHYVKERQALNRLVLSKSGMRNALLYFIAPLMGVMVMLWIFIHMKHVTLFVGSIWMLIGIAYGYNRSNGYRILPSVFLNQT